MHTRLNAVSRLLLVACACFTLASCGEDESSPKRSKGLGKLLATDVHVEIGQHALVLPLGNLDDYARRGPSFSLDRERDQAHAKNELDQLLVDSADPQHPMKFDSLTVTVRAGVSEWTDSENLCPLLTREWARAACHNPWSPFHQALPYNRFSLVDLSRLQTGNTRGRANCTADSSPHLPLPKRVGEAELICTAEVFSSIDNKFYIAVVRIDGNLGAFWTVWRYGQKGETAEAMAEREGKAIVAFVQHGLMAKESFPALFTTLCRLRRPDAVDDPQGPRCRKYVEISS